MTVPPTPQSSDIESHPPQAMMAALKDMVLAMPMARTLGLRFVHAEPGRVEVGIPVSEAFSFRPGQLQATAVFAVADFAAVAAAGSVLPPGWTNATVDTTLKIVAPAQGECLRARGRVVDAGAPAHRLRGRCVGSGCRGAGAAVRHAARHSAQH